MIALKFIIGFVIGIMLGLLLLAVVDFWKSRNG